MANNRLYLVCKDCRKKEKHPANKGFRIAKYYPSEGWTADIDNDRLNQWFKEHEFCNMNGEWYIKLEYELTEKEAKKLYRGG